MTREESAKRVSAIIEYMKEGRGFEEAAELFGVSKSYVRAICVNNGVKPGLISREKRNAEMREYKAQGHTMSEVAERFNVGDIVAQQVCKGIAPQTYRRPQVYRNGWDRAKQEEYAISKIAEKAPWAEYLGGYTNSDGYVDIRCKTCGEVFHRAFVCIRNGKSHHCENCLRIEREKAKELQRKIEADKREWENAGKCKAKQLSFAVCERCGSLFFPTSGNNKKYCSAECMNKQHNSTKRDRRMRKLSTVMVDKDITLKDLFKRDGGVCAICGKRCRWDDKEEREDGTIVTYKDYPSIDHIVPLSKGGKHAWNNIQLACRSCNSRKGDRL